MEKGQLYYVCKNKFCTYNAEKTPFQLDIHEGGTEIMNCPKCGESNIVVMDPQPTPGAGIRKEKPNYKLIGIIAGPIIILVTIAIFLFTGKSNQQKDNKSDLHSEIPNIGKTETPVDNENQPATIENNSEKPESTTSTLIFEAPEKKSDSNNLAANILEEYFIKISDKTIPYSSKEYLKKEVIAKFFADENVLVIEKGANNTEVSRSPIKDYVEELSQQHYKIEVLDKKLNSNQKITTLYIKEL